jgi:patatin-like phospholipase/acyl hydrolase
MAFHILAIGGGGYLGLYSAAVLAQLEQQIGAPIASRFDLLAGTSVGGIIALALANEVPAADIKTAFEVNGTRIFSNRRAPRGTIGKLWDVAARSFFWPKYDVTHLRRTIVDVMGEETRLGDLKHPVLVPVVNLTKGGPQVFKTDYHPDFKRDLYLKVIDVALATAAAPTYFPIAQIGDGLYADGGLFANAPDLVAVHDAERYFGADITDIHVLSIGTTTSRFSFSHEMGTRFGILHWAMGARLVQVLMSSQQQTMDYMLRHRLGDRYVRLDEQQSREQENALALDVATVGAQRTMRALAEVTVQRCLNDPRLVAMLARRAPQPVFYHREALRAAS